jgi:cation diffusion facilitator family transporter
MVFQNKAVAATFLSMLGNSILAIIKGVVGYFGNSHALIADAIESTTDIFASFIVLTGLKYSELPADKNHPYGHGRAETLATFIVSFFLFGSAGIIAYRSIINMQVPHEAPKGYTLIVLACIILIKEIFYRKIKKQSIASNSSSLHAEAWHHRSDAITSLTAFIGISIALIFGKGFEYADDWAALFASGIIIFNGYRILRPALGEVMDEHIYDELVINIRKVSETIPGVINTEKCFVRKSGMKYLIDLHITVDGRISVKAGHDIAHKVINKLKDEIKEIAAVLVHVEPSDGY